MRIKYVKDVLNTRYMQNKYPPRSTTCIIVIYLYLFVYTTTAPSDTRCRIIYLVSRLCTNASNARRHIFFARKLIFRRRAISACTFDRRRSILNMYAVRTCRPLNALFRCRKCHVCVCELGLMSARNGKI